MPELVCRHDPNLAVPDGSPWRNAGWLPGWRHLGTARWPRVGRGRWSPRQRWGTSQPQRREAFNSKQRGAAITQRETSPEEARCANPNFPPVLSRGSRTLRSSPRTNAVSALPNAAADGSAAERGHPSLEVRPTGTGRRRFAWAGCAGASPGAFQAQGTLSGRKGCSGPRVHNAPRRATGPARRRTSGRAAWSISPASGCPRADEPGGACPVTPWVPAGERAPTRARAGCWPGAAMPTQFSSLPTRSPFHGSYRGASRRPRWFCPARGQRVGSAPRARHGAAHGAAPPGAVGPGKPAQSRTCPSSPPSRSVRPFAERRQYNQC